MASTADPQPQADSPPRDAEVDDIEITVHHHGQPLALTFSSSATLQDLSDHVSTELSIPPTHQKFLISPKPGLVKPPFKPDHATLELSALIARKITLLGSTPAEISNLNTAITTAHSRTRLSRTAYTGPLKPTTATSSRARDSKRLHEDTTYTFLTLRPLPHLPDPERSRRFLARLRDDPGIRAAMRAHRWSVPLLTEMDPAAHTTHESRTLGLNRNAGEVIELRLRTDAYDGYRDYRTIRKTLCHELAHNVYGEHDADFWRLCREVEREVEKGDWKSGGRAVGAEEFYQPEGEVDLDGEVVDHAGWVGGEFVLGSGLGGSAAGQGSLSRREILAKAAEERMKKAKETGDGAGGTAEGGGSSST